jgi:hypothetical protein
MLKKKILTVASLAFAGAALFFAAFLAASQLQVQDLAQYWAAAHLVRENPYSTDLVSKFESSSGIHTPIPPLVLKNPPWAIPFILPLGFFSYRVAFAIWSVLSVFAVIGCSRATWIKHDGADSLAPILLPIIVGPTIVLLMLGQWTILVLIGLATFLFAVDRRQDLIAGASLVLVLGKPHVALLFLLAVVFWTIHFRRWRIFISAFISLAACSLAMLAMNAHIFAQFLVRTRQVVGETVPYPNLGGMLYVATRQHWVAILPQIVGVIWLALYWFRRRDEWNWALDGGLVLVSSVACSYYSYPYDEILVLPALIFAYAKGNRRAFLACFVFVEIGYALYIFQIAGRFGFSPLFLWWTASGWLIAFVVTMKLPVHKASTIATNSHGS